MERRIPDRLAVAALDLMSESFLWLDQYACVIWANRAACDMLGRNLGDLRDIPLSHFVPTHPPAALLEDLDKTRTGHPVQRKMLLQFPDGSTLDVEATFSFVQIEDQSYFGCCMRDCLKENQLLEELQSARQTALHALNTRSIFLGNMSHELRTPLNSIIGFSQLMETDSNLKEDQRENLNIINQSGEHLLSLINNILELSRLGGGQVSLREKDFDLHLLLDNIVNAFRQRTRSGNPSLLLDRPADLPRFVLGDAQKIQQILHFLLENALRRTQETNPGSVILRVSSHWESGDFAGAEWKIADCKIAGSLPVSETQLIIQAEIIDNGQPIPPDLLPYLFDAFSLENPAKINLLVNSLELTISQEFSRLMGGDLSVSNSPEGGCSVKFWVRGRLAESEIPAIGAEKTGPDTAFTARPVRRLLLADDQPESRLLLLRILQPFGFKIREASNGKEALETWQSWKPDMIWMNLRMPVLNGYEAAAQIRSHPDGQAVIIIAVTASDHEETVHMTSSRVFDDLIYKPLNRDTILAVLDKHLHASAPLALGDPTWILPGYIHVSKDAETDVIAMLADLSEEYISELRRVTSQGDMESIQNVISKIKSEQPALGNLLEGIAQVFEYDRILHILELDEEIRKYSGGLDAQPGNPR